MRAGLKPFEDIDIVFTGMRRGEKLLEELRLPEEEMSKTRHPKIFVGNIAGFTNGQIPVGIARLSRLCGEGDERELRQALVELVPEARLESARRAEQFPSAIKSRAAVSGSV